MSVLVDKKTKVICQGFTGTHGISIQNKQLIMEQTSVESLPKKEAKNI